MTPFGSVTARAAERLRVRSALNPALWLAAIAPTICFGAAYAFRGQPVLMYGLAVVGVCPVLVTVGGFIYFAVKAPEKLQSEEYQLGHELIQYMQQEGGYRSFHPEPTKAIANPAGERTLAGGGDR